MSVGAVAGQDLPWLLSERVQQWASKAFLIWAPAVGEERQWTYEEFYNDVKRVASGFIAAGLGQGDRILLHLPNSPELLLAWFASAFVGSIAVTPNVAATSDEMAHFITNSQPRFAVVSDELAKVLPTDAGFVQIWIVGSSRSDRPVFSDLLNSASLEIEIRRDPALPISIQYTSGSTSRPKGVLWTQGNAVWAARLSAAQQRLDSNDIYQVFLPFFHTNAQAYSVLPTLWAGGTIVLQSKFSASRFWPVALRHKCTRASLVPFCLGVLRGVPVPDNHHFRTWGFGVAHPAAEEQFNVQFIGWWGMTETISQVIVTDPTVAHPFMSMGYPSLSYDVAIRDENGVEVDEGQLWVKGQRGVSMFSEYFGDPEATAKSFDADGWFATGDIVRRGAGGDLLFNSRDRDIIKCAGENIAPAEIEAIILEVEGVREVAVVGQKSRLYGEIPVAFIVSAPGSIVTEDVIRDHCLAKLSHYKAPRTTFFVDDLPKAAIGKIAKGTLRDSLDEVA